MHTTSNIIEISLEFSYQKQACKYFCEPIRVKFLVKSNIRFAQDDFCQIKLFDKMISSSECDVTADVSQYFSNIQQIEH